MAFALRKDDGDFHSAPMADMNVTPLVDVMLVLLIVFMVAAPLMATGIPLDLPKVQAKPLNDQKPPLVVSIDDGGLYYIDKRQIGADQLIQVLNEDPDNKERGIHVRADKNLPYGTVLEVMGKINLAGYSKVALVSDAPSVAATKASPAAMLHAVP